MNRNMWNGRLGRSAESSEAAVWSGRPRPLLLTLVSILILDMIRGPSYETFPKEHASKPLTRRFDGTKTNNNEE